MGSSNILARRAAGKLNPTRNIVQSDSCCDSCFQQQWQQFSSISSSSSDSLKAAALLPSAAGVQYVQQLCTHTAFYRMQSPSLRRLRPVQAHSIKKQLRPLAELLRAHLRARARSLLSGRAVQGRQGGHVCVEGGTRQAEEFFESVTPA